MRIILLLVLAFIGCSSSDSSNIIIQGVVLEADGTTGIQGVLVTIDDSGKTDVTNKSGGFKFEDHPFFSSFNITVTGVNFNRTFKVGEVPFDRNTVKLVFKRTSTGIILDDVDFLF